MNRFDKDIGGREARVEYLDADYEVVEDGSFVICAVTGNRIPLGELRYWSVDRQEPYESAEAALKRELELNGKSA